MELISKGFKNNLQAANKVLNANQEQFKKSKDTITIVLDKNSNPVWQSHK
jgi:PDZ domain-containing secreted protein